MRRTTETVHELVAHADRLHSLIIPDLRPDLVDPALFRDPLALMAEVRRR